MIVACEHCGARYKLDESRIAGRGAKVTCPKCRHVFVVFKDALPDAGAADAEPPTAVAGAAGPLGAPLPTAGSPSPGAPAAERGADVPHPVGPDVHSLEFRKVGIASWKVKVKIGLVYDFSDFKTLKKYIAEGRVTSADLLSHDGKAWTPIGDIPDLERHFVDVYLRAEAALAPPPVALSAAAGAAPAADDYVEDDPTNIMGMAGLSAPSQTNLATLPASAPPPAKPSRSAPSAPRPAGLGTTSDLNALLAAASAEVDGPDPAGASAAARPAEPTGPRFVDPFEQRRKEKAAARAQAPAASSPRAQAPARGPAAVPTTPPPAAAGGGGAGRLVVLIGLLVLVAFGGGAWWVLQEKPPAPAPKVAGPPPAKAAPPAPVAPAAPDRSAVQQDLLSGSTPATPEEADEAFQVDGEKELIPVGPRDNPRDRRPAEGGGGASAAAKASSPAGDQPMSARDHAAEGDGAYRRGDYATAIAAYRQATGLDPRNAAYQGKLGASLYRSGDTAGAMEPLASGARGGHAASYDLLGDIAAAQGDVSGAIGYYQSYLQARPSDAARVQAKIDRLSGGG